jgi:hypothetical protein
MQVNMANMINKARNKARPKKFNGKFNRKSQVWLSDYIISLLLFTIAVLISVKIIINSFSTNVAFNEIKNDASKMSEMLLSEGYPVNWTNDTVIRPGLLTAKRLDSEKVIKLMNASYISYDPLRVKLQTKYDFLVVFEHPDGNMIEFGSLCAIGKPVSMHMNGSDCVSPDFSNLRYDNMAQLSRFIIYNSEIIRMVVYAWD